jgi:hypothetical protein
MAAMCDDTSDFIEEAVRSVFTDICSVADPGLFIPDPESEIFPSRILGQRDSGSRICNSHQRIEVFLTLKTVSMLSEK